MATINPFQAPINYAVDVQSPFEAALGGFKMGAGVAEAQAKIEAQKQETQNQQVFQTGLRTFFANPDRKFEDLESILPMATKQQFAALQEIGKNMNERRLENAKRFSGQLLVALESNPNIARSMLEQRIEAESDPQQKDAWKRTLDIFDVSPTQAAQMVEYTGAGAFGRDWHESIMKGRADARTARMQFDVERKTRADAEKAVSDAEVALRQSQDTPERLKAEQRLRVAQAALAELKAKNEPARFDAEMGLTEEQKKAAEAARLASDAAAAKSGAEAERAKAEAAQMAAGVIPAAKRPEAESKIRAEYNNQTKPFQEVKSAYGRVLVSEDTAVGDLSLIFGYMKMLDPGSVVREGEFATAQNAAGVDDRVRNIYNKIISGERLSASQRGSFKGQAKKLYESAGQQEAIVRQGLERIAKGYGLNTANIFYTPTETAPSAPAAPITVTLPNGQAATFPTQKAADDFRRAAGIR
jgi:hypothetical protein